MRNAVSGSNKGKPTFSKCFVVLPVMLGGKFSFCFALGQIQPGDKISSQRLAFGIASVKERLSLGQRALSEAGGVSL